MHSRRACYLTAIVAIGLLIAAAFLTDDRMRGLAANTLLVSGCVALLGTAIGAPLAVVLFRTNIAGARLAIVSMSVLILIPLYLQAAAWIAAFGTRGWLAPSVGTGWLNGVLGTIWIHSAASIPWVVLLVGSGLLTSEAELEEEALLDASAAKVLRRVTLRRAATAGVIAALWVAAVTSGDMTVTNLFQVRTFAEEVYTQFEADPDQIFLASLPGVLATAMLVLSGLAIMLSIAPANFEPTTRKLRRLPLGKWRMPVTLATFAAIAVIALLPIASLAYKAGMYVSRTTAGWQQGWSVTKLLQMVASSPLRFSSEFEWSLLVASLAATLAVIISAPLAWYARKSWALAMLLLLLITVCFATPGPVVGIALIRLVNRPEFPLLAYLYDETVLPTVVAQAVRALPVVALVCWHAFRTLPHELLDAAESEGATAGAIFTRLALPMRRSALGAAWLIAFALALGELPASLLVVPPGIDLLSVRIFNLIHYGVDDQVAGICLVLAACFVVIGLVVIAALRAREQSEL